MAEINEKKDKIAPTDSPDSPKLQGPAPLEADRPGAVACPVAPPRDGIGVAEPSTGRPLTGLAFIWETVKIVVISLAIIIPIRYFLVQPFFVKGASMEPTFEDGDYILIDEISFRFKEPARGEVVVFRFPEDRSQFFIKRVIGLPGETVEIKDDEVTIYNTKNPQGFALPENYLDKGQHTIGNMRLKLDPNEYFVMGDNRLRSSDSRRWGALNESLITGRVFFRAWPISKFGRPNLLAD